jgi:hypothetical protein
LRLSRPQGHSAAGRIRQIEKSNGLIGNRTLDLPTTPPLAPEGRRQFGITKLRWEYNIKVYLKEIRWMGVE